MLATAGDLDDTYSLVSVCDDVQGTPNNSSPDGSNKVMEIPIHMAPAKLNQGLLSRSDRRRAERRGLHATGHQSHMQWRELFDNFF